MLIPGFLALCILLGGSSGGGILANIGLQFIATLLLAYSIAKFATVSFSGSAKLLIGIVLCWIAWGVLQLIPLPPSIWTIAPGRDVLEQRLIAGGVAPLPWLPLSLNPAGTIRHLASLLPPLAIGAAILSRPTTESNGLRWAIPLLAFVSLLIGVAQLISGQSSPLYLYQNTNLDLPVGLMANANHQATLMLCAIPFVASLAGTETAAGSKAKGREMLLAAMVVMFLIGIAISRTYAAYVLALPVVVASWLIARPRSLGQARYIGPVIALLTVAALAVVVVAGPKISGDPHVSTAQLSRPAMYAVTVKAVSHFFPLGSGFGSFPPVYRLFEDPNLVTNVFINHTHSDYLELVLEGGIPGVLLVAALLLWWLRRAAAIWFSRSPSRIERAAVIATGAILFHSIVDYPARTSAIAAILGAGLALMVPRSTEAKVEEAPAVGRHLSAE